MRVLFLDVDGVLAPWDTGELDPTCVRRLDTLVRRTGAALVLTSSWREHTPLDAIEAELHAAGLTAPLHDATPVLLEGRGWS
ncbi:MAG TPA: HAD domain-containing protein [Polyangiaceae bacterium LLY-WYZ-15_(1-7)]|nr:HAD domain-containing protein [Polyangiaceae bacterium LLY-WYZ-15_(1-7)]HJL07503.1 HAD domain-containing protein [Polyangiaceae bacterium LLY-WYZ-15_(1-7)]HJL22636.1 HAD domain-containing protein [Polyangiaceae bacterium LLY-WYZ-15_(1-7)]